MEPKRTKYDTNPLDEKVADRADQARRDTRPVAPTEQVGGGPTRDIARPANEAARAHGESEAPTRRIDDNLGTSYPSIFVPPAPRPNASYEPPRVLQPNIYQPPPGPPPNVYQPPPMPVSQRVDFHKVMGLGISEKWANLLPYFPGHVGAVAGLIELWLVPRTETRTRFHAAQGVALQAAILILAGVFGIVTAITDSNLGSGLFSAASTILLIIAMVRAYKGKPLHIAPLDEPRKWLDEKICRK